VMILAQHQAPLQWIQEGEKQRIRN